MPYGVAKARDGDPYNWISDRLAQELGINENLIAPMAMPVATEGAGCNMTMEGEYCPEHGLMECGMGMPAGIMSEGEGNLGKALDTLSGSWSGWHQVKSRNPNIEKFEWDDGEGGFYAGGSIEHNLKTGEVTVDYHGEYDDEVKGTFKNMGDAMRALRGDGGSHGGQAPNFDRLGQRTPPGPDDLRKTDRTGRKGTIGGGYANQLKGSIQANKGRLGPKGVLPEQGVTESNDDPMNYNAAVTGSYYESKDGDALLARIKSLALLK
jgi:hypothetical protein